MPKVTSVYVTERSQYLETKKIPQESGNVKVLVSNVFPFNILNMKVGVVMSFPCCCCCCITIRCCSCCSTGVTAITVSRNDAYKEIANRAEVTITVW
jgi:hypothetical protein